jgi:hypothetical protein
LIGIRHNWGVDQVYYHDSAGRLRMLPITWTSLITADPAVAFGAGQAPFKLSDLLELARLLDGLQQAHQASATQGQSTSAEHREGRDV